jgi:Zn-dependent protease with chaperone function
MLLASFFDGGSWLALFASVGTAMLVLFFVKGVFAKKRFDKSLYIEVSRESQPRIHRFVELLCGETGCPLPRGIYLSHEVNAAVFYPRSLLGLILPARKNLLIGIGLLNVLNLTELKAVLGHEFGHFSQSSMKLGQYVYVANQAIYDMVVTRDRWDEWLTKWRSIDLRVSWPAWLVAGAVWLLRHLLTALFKLVNVANLSLMRQMEFNADRHAVSLTGSDAIVSGLWKAERAELAMQRALSSLHSLAAHKKFSADLFYHQKREYERLDGLLDKVDEPTPHLASLREPYRPGPHLHFAQAEDHAPTMWATHPSNREREEHAKHDYVEHPLDQRPAWMLVDGRAALAKTLTLTAYEHALGVSIGPEDTRTAREIEAAARTEEAEQRQADHYHGLYENRVLEPGNLNALIAALETDPPDPTRCRKRVAKWTGERLAALSRDHRETQTAISLLGAIVEGELDPGPTFELHGETVAQRDAPKLIVQERERLERIRKQLRKIDKDVFRWFWLKSAQDAELRAELVTRYRFLLSVQKQILTLNLLEERLNAVMAVLGSGRELGEEDVNAVLGAFDDAHGALLQTQKRMKKLSIPKLSHLEEASSVAAFALDEPVIEAPALPLTGEWIGSFLRQYGQVIERLRRLHFKNLGVLLRLQEALDPELYGISAQSDSATTSPASSARTMPA